MFKSTKLGYCTNADCEVLVSFAELETYFNLLPKNAVSSYFIGCKTLHVVANNYYQIRSKLSCWVFLMLLIFNAYIREKFYLYHSMSTAYCEKEINKKMLDKTVPFVQIPGIAILKS